ncbi:IS3 family transposase [Fructilactobacillus sp. Tb1]|uniref:IS3 family transposase n=2 Tax=Fructilactobacillus sp. Tb1 TaxID=3422304 RepID=UPI003D289AF9
MPNREKTQIITELRRDFNYPLHMLLDIAEISSSSYHDSLKRDYSSNDQRVIAEIKRIRSEFIDYGYRRITLELNNLGFKINHKKVLRIMNSEGLLCTAYERKTRKYNSYKGKRGKVSPNRINRRFKTDRPLQKIVTDVTEIRWGNNTMNERAYFTAYMDLYNNEIITWSISLHPTVEFVVKPLAELVLARPELKYRMTVHSDQGFQYQNAKFVNILKDNKVFQSMSHKATCLDNACIESFFNQLKVGTTHNFSYDSYSKLKSAVNKYVHKYNNYRIKEKLGGMSPVQYRLYSAQKIA